jgi:hypothetical protein
MLFNSVTSAGLLCLLSVHAVFAQPQTQSQPAFTYLSGPNFCTVQYAYVVPAFCIAPGEQPLGSFTVPSVNASYIDPNFGAKIRLLTDTTLDSVHQYSNPSAFSATGKYVLLATAAGWLRIVEVETGNVVTTLSSDWDMASPRWSALDDDVLYTIGGNSHPAQIAKYQVSTGLRTTLIDYSRDERHFTGIDTGGTGDVAADNWIAFWAKNEHQVCAADLNLIKTYCTDYTAPRPASHVGWGFIDYVLITKGKDAEANKRYVLLIAEPALGVFSVNEETGRLDFEFRGPEIPAGMMGGDSGTGNHDGICDPGETCLSTPHADTFADGGKQYLLLSMGFDAPSCEADLVSLDISKGAKMLLPAEAGGGRKKIMTQYACGLTWSSSHIGCARSDVAHCVISIDTPEPGLPTTIRNGTEPFHSEIMVMGGNGAEIRRLAMHRSVQWQYWDQPRACISPDGSLVLWDTNFGVPNSHRIVVAETGFGATDLTPSDGGDYSGSLRFKRRRHLAPRN